MAGVALLLLLAVLPAADLFAQPALAKAPGSPLPPGAPLPAAQVEAIEAAISSEMSRLGIPGLSVAVARDREVRFASGYGLADVENNVPAKPVTVYRLASVSKPITAVAVLQLTEKGLLDLDAPIQKYVPSFPEKAWPVTARQLLAHLAGVRHYRPDEPPETRHYASVVEGLALFKDDPLVQEPGTKYLYSSYGYNLLGAAVEGASGRPFADYLRENVFGPAGMETTRPDDVAAIIPNRAQGYVRTAEGELRHSALADMSYKIPGGGLSGTAPDIARFVLSLSAGSLLKKDTLALMLSPQRTRDGRPVDYGLGVTLGLRAGRPEVWHTGGQERVSTIVYWQPNSGVVVVLLSNLEKARLGELARRVADQLNAP